MSDCGDRIQRVKVNKEEEFSIMVSTLCNVIAGATEPRENATSSSTFTTTQQTDQVKQRRGRGRASSEEFDRDPGENGRQRFETRGELCDCGWARSTRGKPPLELTIEKPLNCEELELSSTSHFPTIKMNKNQSPLMRKMNPVHRIIQRKKD
eukprot:XP_010652811.1 PREDICTED: uncharacterized protein LOC100245818 [Vitis vinifera]